MFSSLASSLEAKEMALDSVGDLSQSLEGLANTNGSFQRVRILLRTMSRRPCLNSQPDKADIFILECCALPIPTPQVHPNLDSHPLETFKQERS